MTFCGKTLMVSRADKNFVKFTSDNECCQQIQYFSAWDFKISILNKTLSYSVIRWPNTHCGQKRVKFNTTVNECSDTKQSIIVCSKYFIYTIYLYLI